MPTLFHPGDRCAAYRIVCFLGAGACAEVYEVVDHRGQRFALKVIVIDGGGDSRLHARLLREGRALRRIAHPSVVRVHDAGVWRDRVWLLIELVQGVPLHVRLRDYLPPLDKIVYWILQACNGVAEAHRVGIVHRDLKPSNILITAADQVKVIDFGLAELYPWGAGATEEQQVGTAMFMAPEQAQGERADPRMDVYAMGLVLYTALAGGHPMGAAPKAVMDILEWQIRVQPPALREVAPEVPLELAALVHNALEKDPAARLPSMRMLAHGLREVLRRMHGPRREALWPHTMSPTSIPSSRQVLASILRRPPPLPVAPPWITSAPPPLRPRLRVVIRRRAPVPSTLAGERRSSGIPVERATPRASRPPRRAQLVAVAVLLVVFGAAVVWTLLARVLIAPAPTISLPASSSVLVTSASTWPPTPTGALPVISTAAPRP